MQLPKSHTPHKVTKKTEFIKYVNESTSQQVNKTTSQQVNESTRQRVNGSTRNRIIEISRFRDFERAEAIVLTSLTS